MNAFVDVIEEDIAKTASVVQHGAAWLMGMAAQAKTELTALDASSPLVHQAIIAGEAAAAAHGVDLGMLETLGDDVLALAKKVAGDITPETPAPSAA